MVQVNYKIHEMGEEYVAGQATNQQPYLRLFSSSSGTVSAAEKRLVVFVKDRVHIEYVMDFIYYAILDY